MRYANSQSHTAHTEFKPYLKMLEKFKALAVHSITRYQVKTAPAKVKPLLSAHIAYQKPAKMLENTLFI